MTNLARATTVKKPAIIGMLNTVAGYANTMTMTRIARIATRWTFKEEQINGRSEN